MITVDHGRRARLALLAAALLTLAGCATMRRGEGASTEQLLTAAGFQMRPADTPQRLAELSAMPPRKLLVSSRAESVIYTFADPEKCRCLYIGGPQEYSALQRLRVEKEIAAGEPKSGLGWPGLGISWE